MPSSFEPSVPAVVVGNPKPGSRTLAVALAVAGRLSAGLGGLADPVVVNLAEHAAGLFDPGSETVARLGSTVAAADLLVVASPTYKGAYTGLLKAFFDRYGHDALRATVAVAVMTGAAPVHALAVEVHLRPLLVELGATVPARGLFVTEPQIDDPGPAIDAWADAALPVVRHALGVSEPAGTDGGRLGATP